MAFSLSTFLARWSRLAIALCITYSAACAFVSLSGWGGETLAAFLGAWGSFPLIAIIAVFLWPVVTDKSLSKLRRRAFLLIFAAELLDVVASIGWGYDALTSNVTWGSWPDALWTLYYPLVAAACVLLYFDLGGRLNTVRSALDFATV